jgi:hypothetical protein
MSRVVSFNALWQKAFPAALAPASERGPSAFGLHARAEPVLALACALGWLISAFHKAEKRFGRDSRAVTVGTSRALSILRARGIVDLRIASACNFWNNR